MKRFPVLVCCVVFLLMFAGCQEQIQPNSDKILAAEENSFPDFLVGTWKAEKDVWEITFGPNGSVSSVNNFLDMTIDINEGVSEEEGPDGAFALSQIGKCSTKYDALNRKLTVIINTEYFILKLPSGTIEGNSRDEFSGVVSQNGRTWKAQWFGYTELEGVEKPDIKTIPAKSVVFTKIK